MNQSEVIETLRKKAGVDPVANAVFHMWAVRQRTAPSISIMSLVYRMKKEGFKFHKQQYAELLEFLASVGLGRLERSSKGRVKALKDIRFTLQSIGSAAVSRTGTFSHRKNRNRYQELPQRVEQAIETVVKASTAAVEEAPKAEVTKGLVKGLSLTFQVNGKPLRVHLPKDFTTEDLHELSFRVLGPEPGKDL